MFSISSLENFLNHTDNTHLPDAQDGYGNDISQFLGTDLSNCSAVPADIDELQTQISLHGQEVSLFTSTQMPGHVHSVL